MLYQTGRMANRPTPLGDQRGLALVLTLWIGVILALMATGVMRFSQTDIRETRLAEHRLRAELAAESGVATALNLLKAGVVTELGEFQTLHLDETEIRIEVTDEAGRIDLNAAQRSYLAALFTAAGAADGLSEDLADQILARRGDDGTVDAPFALTDGARLLRGMSPELFAAAAPGLTVYTGADRPDPAVAPLIVQKALKTIRLGDVSNPAGQAATEDEPAGSARILRIRAEARAPSGVVFARLAVAAPADRAGDAPQILLWSVATRRLFP